MGRFYKSASANPIDYMYRVNAPLMEKVIEANDQYITDNLNQLGQLGNLASSFGYLQADQKRANEIMTGYNTQIDDITEAIRKDPANWRSQLDNIRNTGKDLANNYRTGEISKIAGNYGQFKSVSDYIDKQSEEFAKSGKGISADRAKAYKQHFLSNFEGTNFDSATGEYNMMKAFNPMSNMDIRKTLSEEMDKMKADGTIKITDELTGSGEYFNKQTQEWEGITPERILRIATDRLNNPQLMDYLKQDSMAGIISGVYNTDVTSPDYGKFIAPYDYNQVKYSSSEQKIVDEMKARIEKTGNKNTKELLKKQLDSYTNNLNNRKEIAWNKDSYLAPILRGVVDEFSYEKTKGTNETRPNSIWETKFNQANMNSRSNAEIASREKMQDRLFEQQKFLQEQKLQADKELKLLELNDKVSKTTSKTGKGVDNNIVGTSYTSPFYWTSENKDNMTSTLNSEISVTDNTIKQLERTLGDIAKHTPDNKIMIASAENQIAAAKAKKETLESQRQNAIDYAINEWKAKGQRTPSTLYKLAGLGEPPVNYSEYNEKLMRGYVSGTAKQELDKATTDLSKFEAQRAKLQPGSPEYNNFMKNTYQPAKVKLGNAQALYTSGLRIFNNEIAPYSNSKLEKAAKETTNRSDVIATTDAQDKMVYDMINASPSNYKIMNKEGKEINLSFEHGTAATGSDKFKINGVSASTGLGDKGIELLATINGQNVIITPKDDKHIMASYFAGQFKNSKDSNIKNIGKIISSPTAGTISDMLTEVRMNTSTPNGAKDSWTYRTIPNPANPNEVIKIRARSVSTGGGEPKWEFQFETNNSNLIMQNAGKNNGYQIEGKNIKGFVPLASSKNPDGVYHNLSDILSIFPSE